MLTGPKISKRNENDHDESDPLTQRPRELRQDHELYSCHCCMPQANSLIGLIHQRRQLDSPNCSKYLSTQKKLIEGDKMPGHGGRNPLNCCNLLKCILLGSLLAALSVGTFLAFQTFTDSIRPQGSHYKQHLKMVSIFSRHADRAPSDGLPLGDRHMERILFFWPNGLHNLTDTGKYRSYRIGLELRRLYKDYLSFDSNEVLSFSSPIYRCIDSNEHILKGLYNLEWPKVLGLEQASNKLGCYKLNATAPSCLPRGSGSPNEWRSILVDTKSIPSLTYTFLNQCKYRKQHPTEIDNNLLVDQEIAALPGLDHLQNVVETNYNLKLNYSLLTLWSTISAEMSLERTAETFNYTSHYNHWVGRPISNNSQISLFELMEQASVIAYRDRIQGEANYIQCGPIFSSLVESQLMSLGYNATNDRMKRYENKKMVLYTTHDSIMQKILFTLKLSRTEEPFEKRHKRYKSSSDLIKFLNGLKMSSYGITLRIELWQLQGHKGTQMESERFNVTRAFLYNREEAQFHKIDFIPIKLGYACRQMFEEDYPSASSADLGNFYDANFRIDKQFDCPFDLFQNVTQKFMLNDGSKLNKLCGDD